eukprot:15360615-Alexandrium_andersonii.AAC.1
MEGVFPSGRAVGEGGAVLQVMVGRPPQFDFASRMAGEVAQSADGHQLRVAAQEYLDFVRHHNKGTEKAWRGVAARGEALAELAGGVEAAAAALKTARGEAGLDNLRGIFDPELAEIFRPDVLDYLKDQAEQGVAARDNGLKLREECKPHQSAADVLD